MRFQTDGAGGEGGNSGLLDVHGALLAQNVGIRRSRLKTGVANDPEFSKDR